MAPVAINAGRHRIPASTPTLSCGDNHSNGEYDVELLQISTTRHLDVFLWDASRMRVEGEVLDDISSQMAQFSCIDYAAKPRPWYLLKMSQSTSCRRER